MAQNKVRALIKYKSGYYEAMMTAPDCYHVGDRCKCMVLSGYETTCKIVSIISNSYHPDGRIGVITGPIKELKNNEEIEEGNSVVDNIFATVVVADKRGKLVGCKSSKLYLSGAYVVYEGSDEWCHVGVVQGSFAPGSVISVPGPISYSASFVLHEVDMKSLEHYKDKEAKYRDILAQLNVRKKALEERVVWEMLAEKDPEARELLKTLDAIIGGGISAAGN